MYRRIAFFLLIVGLCSLSAGAQERCDLVCDTNVSCSTECWTCLFDYQDETYCPADEITYTNCAEFTSCNCAADWQVQSRELVGENFEASLKVYDVTETDMSGCFGTRVRCEEEISICKYSPCGTSWGKQSCS